MFYLCYNNKNRTSTTLYIITEANMKLDILLSIILILLRKKVPAKDLASYFSLSTRTIYRYLSILDTCGIPIQSKPGRHGGISILNTFKLGGLYFTQNEKISLLSLIPYIPIKDIRDSLINKLSLI